MAVLSKDLAMIRKDYEFTQSLDDFKIAFDKEKARAAFEKYGFKSLLEKL